MVNGSETISSFIQTHNEEKVWFSGFGNIAGFDPVIRDICINYNCTLVAQLAKTGGA